MSMTFATTADGWQSEYWQSELEGAPTTGAVRFPNGAELRVVQGPTGDDEDHWDPNSTGNPLLDTSQASTRLSPNFTVGELASSGGKRFPVARIDPRLVACLQKIRERVGRSVTVTSGYRSWAHNKAVYDKRGKKPTKSRHCSGQGADIKVQGLTGMQIAKVAIDTCGTGIGVGIGSSFAHVDVRGRWDRWTYLGGEGGRRAIAEIDAYARAQGGPAAERDSGAGRSATRRAAAANGRYAERLGWRVHLPRITTLLRVAAQRPDDDALVAAVGRWQRAAGLEDDGIIGPATWSKLQAALGIPASQAPAQTSPTGGAAPSPPAVPISTRVRVVRAGWGGYSGLKASRTQRYRADEDWKDHVLTAVGAVEGGFDTVNAYDRGIISWGISQWSAHQGSLQGVLRRVKSAVGPQRFGTLFGGLDVDGNTFVYRGRRYSGRAQISLLFKGRTNPREFDDATTRSWVTRFALAGRDPAVQRVQRAEGRRKLDERLDADVGSWLARIKQRTNKPPSKLTKRQAQWARRLRGMSADELRTTYGPARDYLGDNVVGVTLYYGMTVNNPTWAVLELKRAIDDLASRTGWPRHPRGWPANGPAEMADELVRTFRSSSIGMWGDTKARAKRRDSRTQRLLEGLRGTRR